jgi:hypothetical protein
MPIQLLCSTVTVGTANGQVAAPTQQLSSFRKLAVQMRGEPRYHKIVGGAGKAMERGFCPTCGSHVTDKLERLPNILALQAGSLDDPSMYRPMTDVFTSSAQPWDHMDPKVQKHTHAPR